MTTFKFRQLIDMAIGFPEPGHVNFSALHCLLNCIAEKLGITDEIINYCNNEKETICCCNKVSNYDLQGKHRLFAGYNPNEVISKDEKNELSPRQNAESLEEPEAIPQDDKINAVLNEQNAMVSGQLEESYIPLNEEIPEKKFDVQGLIATASKDSVKSNTKIELSVHKLNERMSKIETVMEKFVTSEAISSGLGIMKDQLEFVTEQLLLLTFLTLSKKPDLHHIEILHSMAQTLQDYKKHYVYTASSNLFQSQIMPILNWQSSGLQLNENISENDILKIRSSDSLPPTENEKTLYQAELGYDHLCYSPEKLLDQLMQLKSEFCLMTNKVNELSSRLLQQESQRTLALIHEIQEEMREVKLQTISLKENQSRIEIRTLGNVNNIDTIKRQIEELTAEKVDKTQLEIQLADKVDYNQLQRKVSLDQILELQSRIDKKFLEILRQINENDKQFSHTIDDLRNTLGFAAIDGILKSFKETITKDIQGLYELLKKYMDSTNDDCIAAGTRIKVLHDLSCLSCDNDCVMRTMEKAKVAKLPNAHSTNILSPLITYELGSIRKSGIMGYYRKDEFPHSTNSWIARQSTTVTAADKNQCVARHAGDQHTTNNAKERIEKMSNRK